MPISLNQSRADFVHRIHIYFYLRVVWLGLHRLSLSPAGMVRTALSKRLLTQMIQWLFFTDNGQQFIKSTFNICEDILTPTDLNLLMRRFEDMWETLAMVNYPYPTTFAQNLPAWPIKVRLTYYRTWASCISPWSVLCHTVSLLHALHH